MKFSVLVNRYGEYFIEASSLEEARKQYAEVRDSLTPESIQWENVFDKDPIDIEEVDY